VLHAQGLRRLRQADTAITTMTAPATETSDDTKRPQPNLTAFRPPPWPPSVSDIRDGKSKTTSAG
jgi:hypothetical protein